MTTANTHWVLTLVCKDQPGIVHAISGAIVAANGNITESSQFTSDDTGRFFMRLQIESAVPREHFEGQIAPVAERYGMTWELDEVGRKMKTLVLVSKSAHCLNDILFRQRAGQLPVELPAVFGNHSDLQGLAEFYGIPFEVHPITGDTDKRAFENMLRTYIKTAGIELIVLARYMQIITPKLIELYKNKIINIHHSFLPAFPGAKPYHSAFARGVKIIGATSHYVTQELDAGPIIEQDVTRVTHTHSINDLIAKGRDLEKIVLSNAVKLHANRKVMVYNNKTIIFS